MRQQVCSLQGIKLKGENQVLFEQKPFVIKARRIIALIAKNQCARGILQEITGAQETDEGKIQFMDETIKERRKVQYVPDDIVCYTGLTVGQFIHGLCMKEKTGKEVLQEAERLLTLFSINPHEQLLDMTFEQNRLVTMIQALMWKPELLLLDQPYDMLGEEVYYKLMQEIHTLYDQGTSVVIAADSYESIGVPCHEYIFFEEGQIEKCLSRKELPVRAKVITMHGGSLDVFEKDKIQVLYQKGNYCRFLYQEKDTMKLTLTLSKAKCRNIFIDEVTMQEQILGNWERWQ